MNRRPYRTERIALGTVLAIAFLYPLFMPATPPEAKIIFSIVAALFAGMAAIAKLEEKQEYDR